MRLNNWELAILKIAKDKGEVTINDISLLYRTSSKRSDVIKRLISWGYLVVKTPGVFGWTGKEFSETKQKRIDINKVKELYREYIKSKDESYLIALGKELGEIDNDAKTKTTRHKNK